jgi:hypothetical protein
MPPDGGIRARRGERHLGISTDILSSENFILGVHYDDAAQASGDILFPQGDNHDNPQNG